MNEKLSNILQHRATVPSIVGVVSGSAGLLVGFIAGREHMARQMMPEVEKLGERVKDLQREITRPATSEDFITGEGIRTIIPGQLEFHGISLESTNGAPGTSVQIIEEQNDVVVVEDDAVPASTPTVVEEATQLPPPVIIDAQDLPVDHEDIDLEDVVVGVVEDGEVVPVEGRRVNVFENETTPWDGAGEELKRERMSKDDTYQVSYEEFFDDDVDYRQHQYTFFLGDQVLVDENNVPIHNHSTIFPEFKFGYGSNEHNVAYFRNDGREADWEITSTESYYAVEFLGQEMTANLSAKELRHSSAPRRMRREE